MTAPFAELETRLNASIQRHMPNAEATHATLGTALVVFADEGLVLDGMLTGQPTMLVSAADWPTPADGDAVVVSGTDYVLRTPIRVHNGARWRIALERDA